MKKGFTLVELLCVIIIIAVVTMIAFPLVTSYINKSKEKLYDVQVNDIESAAKKWSLENIDKLDKYHINDIYVTLEYIKHMGYLEKDEILSPKTKEIMDGCVLIKYDNTSKQYLYNYMEIECATELDSEAYIIYSYNDGEIDPVDVMIGNKKTPFYLDLLEKNSLKVIGETEDGLYDTGNEYVFKGNIVNNYVKYGGNTWRILSIDKSDYSMKLISVTGGTSIWSSSKTDYSEIDLKSTLEENLSKNIKILDVWANGNVSNVGMTLDDLNNALKDKTINVKAGLISIYDYVSASTNASCNANFLSTECKTNNYLTAMFTGKNIWTMNTDGHNIWYINLTGDLGLQDPSTATYYTYTVIKVPINVYSTNASEATGSEPNFAYELK